MASLAEKYDDKPPIDLFNDHVLIVPDKEEIRKRRLQGSILLELPQDSRGVHYKTGRVVAVGPGLCNIHGDAHKSASVFPRVPMDCQVGDIVIYAGNAAPMILQGQQYELARDVSILGKLK